MVGIAHVICLALLMHRASVPVDVARLQVNAPAADPAGRAQAQARLLLFEKVL